MKIQEAHADCLLRVVGNLELHKTVVVCNTFTTENELHPWWNENFKKYKLALIA